MHLFRCANAQPEHIADATSVLTPLGNVQFQAAIGQEIISNERPSATNRLFDGGWVAGWYYQAFSLELLVCRPTLPSSLTQISDFPLQDCWAGMWRLQTRLPVASCLFAVVWKAGYTWQDGGPDSGEHLYAKTWDDGQTEVAVGTQDEERLAYRAEKGDGIPRQLQNYFCANRSDERPCAYWQHEAHSQLRDIGVPTPLPALEAGQFCQLHFAVAWANYDKHSVTTWLAVDRKDADILMGANCQ